MGPSKPVNSFSVKLGLYFRAIFLPFIGAFGGGKKPQTPGFLPTKAAGYGFFFFFFFPQPFFFPRPVFFFYFSFPFLLGGGQRGPFFVFKMIFFFFSQRGAPGGKDLGTQTVFFSPKGTDFLKTQKLPQPVNPVLLNWPEQKTRPIFFLKTPLGGGGGGPGFFNPKWAHRFFEMQRRTSPEVCANKPKKKITPPVDYWIHLLWGGPGIFFHRPCLFPPKKLPFIFTLGASGLGGPLFTFFRDPTGDFPQNFCFSFAFSGKNLFPKLLFLFFFSPTGQGTAFLAPKIWGQYFQGATDFFSRGTVT